MKATSIMTRNVICICPEDTLVDAYALMTEWQVRHLPVLSEGLLVGILSDRDVLLHARRGKDADGLEIEAVTVAEAMTAKPMTRDTGATLAEIGALMLEMKIDSIPIVDHKHGLVGLVTSSDLIECLCSNERAAMTKPIPFHYAVITAARPGATAI